MNRTAKILVLLLLTAGTVRAEEVLPTLSDEKMSEYKNAFGKAISDSMESEGKRGRPAPGTDKGEPRIGEITKRLQDDLNRKGPPPQGGPGRPDKGGGPGRGEGRGEGDASKRPPGFGGPGQPGGPGGPGGPPHPQDGSKGPGGPH